MPKTESQQTQKSSPQTSSTADTEIFTVYRLLHNQNLWRKPCRCRPRNHHRKPVLGLTLKSSRCIENCRIRNHLRKLCRCRTRNHHRKPVLRLILKSSRRMDYCIIRNLWRIVCRCRPRNHHRKPVLRLTLIFSAQIDHCRIRNHRRNCVGADPEIITGNQFYGDTEILRRINCSRIRNHWRKLGRCRPRNDHRKPV